MEVVASARIRVLLVEDDPRDVHVLRSMLRSAGFPHFEFFHARTINEALDQLGRNPVDVVILDLGLPDASDLEGLERLREFSAETPLIVLTGNHDDTLAMTALHRGAQDYLIKGNVDRHLLVRSIRYAIERHRGV